jgi:hypothetical protein
MKVKKMDDWLSWLRIILPIIGVLALVAWILAHLFLHVRPTPVNSFAELKTQLGRGRPTLIYFYSNF